MVYDQPVETLNAVEEEEVVTEEDAATRSDVVGDQRHPCRGLAGMREPGSGLKETESSSRRHAPAATMARRDQGRRS